MITRKLLPLALVATALTACSALEKVTPAAAPPPSAPVPAPVTGESDAERADEVAPGPEIAQRAPAAEQGAIIIRAGNMSLGVNLLTQLTKRVAAALDEDYDIEVIEAHHNQKVDAPSGTALMLGEAAAEGRGVSLKDVSDSGRDGITGARKRGDIGFSAIRGGDIVGEHARPAAKVPLLEVLAAHKGHIGFASLGGGGSGTGAARA